ncbi:MAG: family 10 glycosylhydrolase [Cyanobacteria bacterium J06638_28]
MRKYSKWVAWFFCGLAASVALFFASSAMDYAAAIVPHPTIEDAPEALMAQGFSQEASDLLLPGSEAPILPAATVPEAVPQVESSTPAPHPASIPVSREQVPLRTAPTSQRLIQSEDPAEQIAPPGLDIQPGNAAISSFLALAMQQELDNLVGRFESALLLADSADQPVEVKIHTVDKSLSASDGAVALSPELHPALVNAQQLKQDWSDLIQNRSYGEARDRWLAVRQDLWQNFPTDRTFSPPEMRAMWLDRGSIVRAGSRQRLAALFDNMQNAGINTVFLETVNAGYPIYPSRLAPSQNPLTRRWNPLATAIELAHERNMELHAWLWIFAAGNQRHNDILNLPDNYLGPVLNAHARWAAYDNQGNNIPKGQTKPFYDPANPEARRYILGLIDEVISNYEVDGIQLDYIRYPFQDPGADRTYGYGLAARQQFRRMTGVDPLELTPRVDPWLPAAERQRQLSLWQKWTDFRIKQVTSFVEATSELVRRKRPDVVLSTAVFAIPEHERLQKIQQDWGDWAKRGLVDWVMLMSYAQDTNRFSQLIQPWLTEQDYDSTLIIPGIRLLNLSVPAMIDQIQALRDLPATGYALFATDNLSPDVQAVLHQTQGSHGQLVPQQTPYETAAQRFQALQREWNWLLANRQLLLVDPKLAETWPERINRLGTQLSGLSPASSLEQVNTIQQQIQELSQSLGSGMQLQTATTRDYRLQTWHNRLESISRFLSYGKAQPG